MSVVRGLRNSIAFLTILPVGMDSDGVDRAAEFMPLFPIVGALIGLITGTFVWILEQFLPPLVAGMLAVGLLALLNGVQHMDGLLDFGDGLMCHGSKERKLRVMQDPQTGAGGFCLGSIVLFTAAFAIAAANQSLIIQILTASEAAAAFSMVLEAWAGKSAHEGMNSKFVQAMHSNYRYLRLALPSIFLLTISILALRALGIVLVVNAVIVAAIMLLISGRAFGGVTGDVFGATNELTRLTSLLTILVAVKWFW